MHIVQASRLGPTRSSRGIFCQPAPSTAQASSISPIDSHGPFQPLPAMTQFCAGEGPAQYYQAQLPPPSVFWDRTPPTLLFAVWTVVHSR